MNEILRRVLPLLLLVLLCTGAMLYHFEVFDLSFIDRPGTDAPETLSPEQENIQGQLGQLGPGDSITGIVSPVTTAGPAQPQAPTSVTYPAYAELAGEGFVRSWDDWHETEGMVLAKLSLGGGFTWKNQLTVGDKTSYLWQSRRYEEDGERFGYVVDDLETRYGIELYGGYLFAAQGDGTVAVADSEGRLIGRYSAEDVIPANTRD